MIKKNKFFQKTLKYILLGGIILGLSVGFYSLNFKEKKARKELNYSKIITDLDNLIFLTKTKEKDVLVKEKPKKKILKEKKIIKELPKKVHYNVPFTAQAPFRNWGEPWQEACEETAVLITMRYFDKRGFKDKYDARQALLEIIDWENKTLGFYKDTDTKTTAKIITDFYKYKNIEISSDVSLKKIKEELAQGNLIIIPTAGRNLKNPYFTPPGPIYHNLVIVGYNDNEQIFYTNDPGIMSGKDFKYSYQNILDSVADWDYQSKTINKDKKIMIIVKKPLNMPVY